MTPRTAHRAWLLGEFRRVEWRRLLLAVALLTAWARALAPLPAQAAVETAGAVLCTVGALTSGAGDVRPDGAHETRACPFCRLVDLPDGLVPLEPEIADARLGAMALRPIPAFTILSPSNAPHPPARGPPATITTP